MLDENRYTKSEIRFFMNDGQSLEEADLQGSKLRGMPFYKQNFKRADLREADLSHADLRAANFEGADLRGADLIGANLTRANLSKANLEGARLDLAVMQRANLSEACFKKANLYHALMKGAILTKTDFTEANLREASLIGVEDASKAKFNGADLTEARVKYSGLDVLELGKVGAKGGSRRPERGWQAKVFDLPFAKASWTEFLPSFKWLLTPFKLILVLLGGLLMLLRIVFKKLPQKKKTSKA